MDNSSLSRRLGVLQSHLLSRRLHSVASAVASFASSRLDTKSATSHVDRKQLKSCMVIAPEVERALTEGRAVVALESTIITHGMSYPHNKNTALLVEETVRKSGAIPATIAILFGRIHVGLSHDQIEWLAQQPRSAIIKCSRRDLAAIVATQSHGSTTVAATLIVAELAGISVFVTGGAGGVHHGFAETMDVSADLYELQRTPVTLVCAGVKSILDIPKTLELLESLGVPTLGWGTREFPAFFTAHSGCPCSMECPKDPKVVARIIDTQRQLGLQSGIVLAVPVPEEHAADGQRIEAAIQQALAEATAKNIRGHAVTPFLLGRISEITGGESLKANVALIENNARIGGMVACALAEIRRPKRILCAGAVLMDVLAEAAASRMVGNTSNPGKSALSAGGVGYNVYCALTRIGVALSDSDNAIDVASKIEFLTAVNPDDAFGSALLQRIPNRKFVLLDSQYPSGSFTAVFSSTHARDGEEAFSAVADTRILEHAFQTEYLQPLLAEFFSPRPSMLLVDGNIPAAAFKLLTHEAHKHGVPVFFEPTSIPKASMPITVGALDYISFAKPCLEELFAMAGLFVLDSKDKKKVSHGVSESDCAAFHKQSGSQLLSNHHFVDAVVRAGEVLCVKHNIRIVFCTLGKVGGLVIRKRSSAANSSNPRSEVRFKQLAPSSSPVDVLFFAALPIKQEEIVNATGAGDCFAAGAVYAMLQDCGALEDVVWMGMQCALQTLRAPGAVPDEFSFRRAIEADSQHVPLDVLRPL
jgi:pseudouridine-5'-phosphate glycosidase/pseudouridine kinase